MFRTAALQIAALSLFAAASACGGKVATVAPSETPAWFQQKLAAIPQTAYPELSAVPEAAASTRTDAQYRALERDLWNERARIQASQRSEQPPESAATAASADQFEREVRARIDNSRPPEETAPPVAPAPIAPR